MKIENIESSCRLSPMQAGMLFHHEYSRDSGVDIEQLVCGLHEELDISALGRAWQRVVDRHAVLRTGFRWEGLPEPVQEAYREVRVQLEVEDWRGLPAAEQEKRRDEYLRSDRKRGFDLAKPPLMRLSLIRIADSDYSLIWTFHHALLDGRSFPIVLNEVFAFYQAYSLGRELELRHPRPYSDYIHWLHQQDLSRAEVFWRNYLKGFSAPTPLGTADRPAHPPDDEWDRGEREVRLSENTTALLASLAKNQELSMNILVQGAWAVLLSRYSGEQDVVFGATRACRHSLGEDTASMVGTFINTLPVRVRVSPDASLASSLKQLRADQATVREYEHTPLVMIQGWSDVPRGTRLFESILVFDNYLLDTKMRAQGGAWTNRNVQLIEQTNYPLTLYGYNEPELLLKIAYDRSRFTEPTIERMLGHLRTLLEGMAACPDQLLSSLPLLTEQEKQQILVDWNDTRTEYQQDQCIHELIEKQVEKTPEAVAVVFEDQQLTYWELNGRANQLARYLQKLGVGPETRVGICLERSLDMLVGLLGIMKAGGAYVPLDPSYPRERLAFMLEDAQLQVIVTYRRLAGGFANRRARLVSMDTDWEAISQETAGPVQSGVSAENLAYLIYTSGSTGKPKGVMVCHRNVGNFFAAMDQKIGAEKAGVWLAVTSISFDISVLELFWTLSRGFRVILQGGVREALSGASSADLVERKPILFSLFYFASDERADGDRYRLLMEGAKFADRNGFAAVWTPERHFHPFGGLFPNPAVTSAALAMITKNLAIRAGSVVLPLHNPIRVAEEWAVIDNLSHGRVGLSFASGWHDRDFVFAPEHYSDRKKVMMRDLETVRALWRGESIMQRSGSGKDVSVSIFPRPVQPELPFWITAGGDPQTFRAAGEIGANLLTHLLGQTIEELQTKIELYRRSFAERSDGRQGHVTLMLHTFVGTRDDEVEEVVRTPFCNYLKSSVDLMKQVARGLGEEIAGTPLSDVDLSALIDHAFHRYFATSGLFGSPESCLAMVNKLKQIGVDEIACLVDFGVESETVLANLENLHLLAEKSNEQVESNYTISEQIARRGVTHMQCTPSLARVMTNTPEGRRALGSLQKLLIGGEALSSSLADDLHEAGPGEIWNMYGPTETTVWSTMEKLEKGARNVWIGRPIANTSVFVLDENQQPVPVGVPGELYIGGEGVVRGYLDRPDLTAEKFLRIPFSKNGDRVYRTGDLVRYLPDGRLDFLGRLDHQIKIRGHRIELGEIEATLSLHPGVREAIVSAADDRDGGKILVAYMIKNSAALSTTDVRTFLESRLPPYMVPSSYVLVDAFPLTPNGKIDRKRLPKPEVVTSEQPVVAPRNTTEAALAQIWAEALRIPRVGIHDNFFELGGHSLSAVNITAKIRAGFSVPFPLQAVLDNPTIAQLAAELETLLTSETRRSASPAPIARSSARRKLVSTKVN